MLFAVGTLTILGNTLQKGYSHHNFKALQHQILPAKNPSLLKKIVGYCKFTIKPLNTQGKKYGKNSMKHHETEDYWHPLTKPTTVTLEIQHCQVTKDATSSAIAGLFHMHSWQYWSLPREDSVANWPTGNQITNSLISYYESTLQTLKQILNVYIHTFCALCWPPQKAGCGVWRLCEQKLMVPIGFLRYLAGSGCTLVGRGEVIAEKYLPKEIAKCSVAECHFRVLVGPDAGGSNNDHTVSCWWMKIHDEHEIDDDEYDGDDDDKSRIYVRRLM